MSRILNYNEQKVKSGTAELLFASGFIKRSEKLTFYDKMRQFERYISLNERSTNNGLHISLNFDQKDDLSPEKIIALSEVYMTMIGYGHQPFLVYQHFDAGHPHIHIVTTNIQKDGSRISTHNLGRNQSEKARKEMEVRFGLIKAETRKMAINMQPKPVDAQKIIYGKLALKQAVSNVIKEVIDQYKFSSLPELNAILSLYHVHASRGEEKSSCFKHGGLVFKALGSDGLPAGPPLKASSFYFKPTLVFLQSKFKENEPLKKAAARRFMVEIQFALAKAKTLSLANFIKEMEAAHFSTVLRKSKEGLIYGITYVDHKTKTVFNGSDLGREYSAKAILEACNMVSLPTGKVKPHRFEPQVKDENDMDRYAPEKIKWVNDLIGPEHNDMTVPFALKKDQKKKKKRRTGL